MIDERKEVRMPGFDADIILELMIDDRTELVALASLEPWNLQTSKTEVQIPRHRILFFEREND